MYIVYICIYFNVAHRSVDFYFTLNSTYICIWFSYGIMFNSKTNREIVDTYRFSLI